MPTDLTIFAAQYLVFVAAVLAATLLALRLMQWPRVRLLRWVLAAGLVLVLSFGLAQLGGAVYNDPRPFVTGHVHPLIPHAPDNGFPSDHALLAAALVALVGMAEIWWALPIVVLALLVDWARVGAGLHHVVDVVGSSIIVAVATLLAFVITAIVAPWLTSLLPADWRERRLLQRQKR